MSFVSVRNVWQRYDDRSILERVNVSVDEGEFISIVGASGCGKSTFLRMLLAEERPHKGEISIDGGDTAVEPNRERGVVFQKYSVFPHMTVRDNLIAGESFERPFGRLRGAARTEAAARADAMLERIGLNHVADQFPAALSGGMQQRLAIGQAMTARPRILLLDEPFGALDPGTRLQMHDFLMELRDETNMTVFMVTHDLQEGFKLGDRVLVFDKPRWDPDDPGLFGATITYDFDARNKGMPYQDILDQYPSLAGA
ncbi:MULTISPECIES: ATP-binding cassette domain-containing protein [unclassified Ruegeria]|uniref:ATP-binding cassette domain-containing protein n=1 Tax=unclassified Ruegeria TaxID=2625375 RepID=UPI001AD9E0C6|nr:MULTISPECIES: ATP-binding cassette domain-containing protein [unclassified Ruegeria]MBO9412339.1 ATP-binding cassette domain-containing protein [Ruegeria sp. R8_1]MBO9416423.1 ATP-binding cassette domain-containing protein [Ruegeria sp. R8_2]